MRLPRRLYRTHSITVAVAHYPERYVKEIEKRKECKSRFKLMINELLGTCKLHSIGCSRLTLNADNLWLKQNINSKFEVTLLKKTQLLNTVRAQMAHHWFAAINPLTPQGSAPSAVTVCTLRSRPIQFNTIHRTQT
jgi:hypothetical protein